MTIQDLGSIGELFGAIATIATLVYLATQIRHNTKAARSDSAWSATVALAELSEGIAASPQLADLVMRAHDPATNPEDLSDSEFAQIYFVCRSVLFKYEGQWFYWKEGTLSDEMWQNRRRWAKAFVSLPVPGRVWEREMAQHQYSAGFIESIESMESPADVHIRV